MLIEPWMVIPCDVNILTRTPQEAERDLCCSLPSAQVAAHGIPGTNRRYPGPIKAPEGTELPPEKDC